MGYRTFVDRDGSYWQVWDSQPTKVERRAAAADRRKPRLFPWRETERRSGQIAIVSSLAAFSFNPVSGAAYTAAKLGMLGMSDSINAEEGIHGIHSVCICPGETETPILNKRPVPLSQAERDLMAQPEDIAAAALFCASLPQRTCVPRLVINPTNDRFVRRDAEAIAALPSRR